MLKLICIGKINVDWGNYDMDQENKTIMQDLRDRNKANMNITAHEYFGNKYSYKQAFEMINDYKKAFVSLDGTEEKPITISAPSTVASVNSFYGAMDANKIVNMTGPGFLYEYTKKYTTDLGSDTVVIFDTFLNEEFIKRLSNAGVKNVIIMSITDYMNPIAKKIAQSKGMIPKEDFLDSYVKKGNVLPKKMNFIRIKEFATTGKKIKEDYDFPYRENRICAYFLTGATTSKFPKDVKLYEHGFNNMAKMYDNLWFGFKPGDRHAIFIPLFYATGAVHGIHAGFFSGMTLIYKPKYDRFAFGKDLYDSKAKLALVAPSHVAALENANLEKNSLNHVTYIFVGGEAIMPAQMKKFREMASNLGIKYIINGYGMTETASMTAVSDKIPLSEDDVTVIPTPGVKYRIVDPVTREILPSGKRGILEKTSPCQAAGYIDESRNKELFTSDGWINTGDIAIEYPNGRYRIFGRETDYFKHGNSKYAMFDIEEKVLEHPGIVEAEVIKFNVQNNEYPAIVVVLNERWQNRKDDVLKYISNIKIGGMEYLLGTKFITKFKTNSVTGKRDYLSLTEDTFGYYNYDFENNKYYQLDIEGDNVNKYLIDNDEIQIKGDKDYKKLIKE